jgi:hypothetical protein
MKLSQQQEAEIDWEKKTICFFPEIADDQIEITFDDLADLCAAILEKYRKCRA